MTEADGVACLLAPNPSPLTGPGTNTYVVSSREGPCVVIDPGPAIEAHLAAVRDFVAARGRLHDILVTHGHADHAEGAARLRALTGAPVLASSQADPAMADAALDDGAVVRVGERILHVMHTPGHRFDHLCFVLEDARALFAGDMVAGSGTVLIAPPEGDLSAYLGSLRRLQALDLAVILPGHGPALNRPRDTLSAYLTHRLERERQVLDALDAGPHDVAEVVDVIYQELDPALRPAAALTVTAHLLKLEQDGRARRCAMADGRDGWSR